MPRDAIARERGVLKGDDKGTYAIADGGVPIAGSGFSAGADVQVMPVFYQGNPEYFTIKNVEGTRLEINAGIPGTPIAAGGFKSIGSIPQETTFGLYVGAGKSASIKGISLNQPFQINIGTTNVIGK